jgi:hypothetical protein
MADSDEVHFWSLKTGKSTKKLPGRGFGLALSPDGKSVAVGGYGAYLAGPGEPAAIRINQVSIKTDIRTTLLGADGNEPGLPLNPAGGALAFSPDGHFLAVGRGTERHLYAGGGGVIVNTPNLATPVQFLEVATGKPALTLGAAPTDATAIAVSPDGTRLAACTRSGEVKILDLKPARFDAAAAKKLTRKDAEALWQKLAGADAPAAYEAAWTLAAAGDVALALCKQRLRTTQVDPARVKRLLADLESRRFSARDAALKELRALGTAAEADVRRALGASPSLDARKKLEDLARVFDRQTLSGNRLLHNRGVLVLERVATPAARDLLKKIADGEGQTYLGRQARLALDRVARR